MKKLSKVLILIFAVALICTGLVMVASADSGIANTVSYTAGGAEATGDLATAISKADADTTIYLKGDVTVTSAITVAKALTVNLNGYTLNANVHNTFVVNDSFTITGEGTINAIGTLYYAKGIKAGEKQMKIVGTGRGIYLYHSGSAFDKISSLDFGLIMFYSSCHNYKTTLENVEILSEAYIHANPNATKIGDDYNTRASFFRTNEDSNGIVWNFKNVKFYRNVELDSTMVMTGPVIYAAGTASSPATVNIVDSTIINSGPIMNFGYNHGNTDTNFVLADVQNSHLEVAIKNVPYRVCAISSHQRNGGYRANAGAGTIKFTNSFIGGTCFRTFWFDRQDAIVIKLDNSVISNRGANVINGSDSASANLVRGATLKLANGSTVIGANSDIVGPSSVVTFEVGTRFNDPTVIESEVKWVDKSGNAVTGVSIVFDPIGNLNYPWVSTTGDVTAYAPDGATAMEMITFEAAYGKGSGSEHGFVVDGVGDMTFVMNNMQFAARYDAGSAAFTTYGENNNGALKYWINPTADKPTYGSNRVIPGNYTVTGDDGKTVTRETNSWMVIGSAANYNTSINKIANSKVAVFDFDFATDSEYGFPRLGFSVQSRTASNGNTVSTTQFTLYNNGSFENKALNNFNSNIKLNHESWNRITMVVYTDATYTDAGDTDTSKVGQAFFFVNGELLGYTNDAFVSTTGFIQGVRVDVLRNVNQRIGSSFLIDNVCTRSYEKYLGASEADGAKKTPTAYFLGDEFKNTSPCNNKILASTTNYGTIKTEFATIADAVKAANKVSDANVKYYPELNGNISSDCAVNVNTVVVRNGYSITPNKDSYGFVADENTYTFNENYKYNISWYIGAVNDFNDMLDPTKYETETVKLGFEVDKADIWTEKVNDFTNYLVVTQQGWSYETNSAVSSTPFVPTLAELGVANENGGTISMYPAIVSLPMYYYVTDASGNNVRVGISDDEFTTEFTTVVSGTTKTITLCRDVYLKRSDSGFKADAITTINLNLNGKTLNHRSGGTIAALCGNVTMNVYSTESGAEINCYGPGNNFYARRMFAIAVQDGSGFTESYARIGESSNNTLNIGTIEGIEGADGANLTLRGGVIVEGVTGDSTNVITVDGVHVERVKPESTGMVMTRYYNGKIILKNSTFINDSGNFIDLKGLGTDGKTDGVYNNKGYNVSSIVLTPTVIFDNCVIINLPNNDCNLIGNNGDGYDGEFDGADAHHCLTFKDCIISLGTNAKLNGSNQSERTVFIGTNIITDTQYSNTYAPYQNSYIDNNSVYAYNAPVTLESLGLKTYTYNGKSYAIFQRANVVNGVSTMVSYAIVENGAFTAAEIEALKTEKNLIGAWTLPKVYKYAITQEENTFAATFKGVGTNADSVVRYYKGGNVSAIGTKDCAMNAITLKQTGWETLPTNIQSDVTINPTVTPAANVSGFKANLSLYSDFIMNLYVPVKYENEIVSIKIGDEALAGAKVSIADTDDYIKVVASKLAKEASDEVVFTINLAEGGYEASTTVTLSITAYASQVLTGDFTYGDKALMYYMLTYANEAKKYFNDSKGDDAIEELLNTYAEWKIGGDAENTYENSASDFSSIFSGATVQLTETPAFVFIPNGNFAGKVTVTYGDGNVRTFDVEKGDKSYLVITGMKIFNFSTNVKVTAEGTLYDGETVNEDYTFNGTYNLESFAAHHQSNAETNPDSAACLDIIDALYNYVKIAEAYKAGTLVDPNGSDAE